MRKTPPKRRHLPPAAAVLALPFALMAGGVARAAYVPFGADPPRWGAIYASPSAAGFGMTVGLTDRQAARRGAEGECRRRSAAGCRLVAEFAERCAAVAQSVERRTVPGRGRTRFELRVTATAAGTGRTGEEAENAALRACERTERGGVCLVAATACGAANLARH